VVVTKLVLPTEGGGVASLGEDDMLNDVKVLGGHFIVK